MDATRLSDLRRALAGRGAKRLADPPGPEAAVAVVLAEERGRGLSVLLVRRAERAGDPWSGHMAFPGGRRAGEAEDLLDTARRETGEEVGLSLAPAALLGELDEIEPRMRAAPQVRVRPYAFGLETAAPLAPNHEIAEALWTPLAELVPDEDEFVLRGQSLRLPIFRVGERRVWGLTWRILSEVLELLEGRGRSA